MLLIQFAGATKAWKSSVELSDNLSLINRVVITTHKLYSTATVFWYLNL